jgi:hypothetical protein
MTAEQLYAELDRAGLTPPVHYCAAPQEWREALERIEVELTAEVWQLDAAISRKDRQISELTDDLNETEQDNRRLLSRLAHQETAAQ